MQCFLEVIINNCGVMRYRVFIACSFFRAGGVRDRRGVRADEPSSSAMDLCPYEIIYLILSSYFHFS